MLHRTCIALAAVVLAGGLTVAAPADAGPVQGEAVQFAAHDGAEFGSLAEGALSLGLSSVAQQATELRVADGTPARSATLSVNMAILLLGSLWLTLMVRRIQLRLADEGLSGARPHAAGGH